jgi:hypothetical protein
MMAFIFYFGLVRWKAESIFGLNLAYLDINLIFSKKQIM